MNMKILKLKFKTINLDRKSSLDLVTKSKKQVSKSNISKMLNESFSPFVDFTGKYGYERIKLLS